MRAILNIPQLNEAKDYTVSLKARKLSGAEGFLILFRTKDDQNWMWWNIAGWQNRETGIESSIGGSTIAIGGRHADSVEIGKWYDVKIELNGSSIKCYLNGKLIQTETERALPTFTAIAGRRLKSNEIILKVINGSNDARTVTLDIEGVTGLQAKGVATEMTSGSLEDENALNDPLRISPKTSAFNCPGAKFPYVFKPRSVTILKLREKR